MSDEEDTAILLGNEQKCPEKDIKTNPNHDTYQDINQNNSFQIYLSSFAVFASGICFGYDLGIVVNLIRPIADTFLLDCSEQSYIISIWLLGAIMSAILGGFIIDICGRKWSVVCSCLLLVLSSALSSISKPFAYLLCSRFISGFSGPLLAISQSVYTSETSGTDVRGFRISLQQLGSSLGTLMSFAVSLCAEHSPNAWKIALGLTGIPAFVTLIITSVWLPRSPHFLLFQRSHHLAKRPSNNARFTILTEIFVIAVFLIIFQQLSGRQIVFFYAPRIFSLLGICANRAVLMTHITFASVKFVSTCICVCTVDRLGRRTSLIMSSTIMMTCTALLALMASVDDADQSFSNLYREHCHMIALPESTGFVTAPHGQFWFYENPSTPVALAKSPPPFPMLPTPLSLVSPAATDCADDVTSVLSPASRILVVVTLLLFEAAHSLGFGTLTWVLLSELFPASLRGRGICAVMCLKWLGDLAVPSSYIEIGPSLGSTFLIYSLVCMSSVLFTFFALPDTKGQTLHQIGLEFHSVSLATRFFRNLHALPFFTDSQWLRQRAQQHRQQSKAAIESTII